MFVPLFLQLAGFVVGLGAVTVIDFLGFLGRTSPYWTEATVRGHKVTKPMIWSGLVLMLVGGAWRYAASGEPLFLRAHLLLCAVLVANGCLLSFVVSPFLLKREKAGKASEILPSALQGKIAVSFVFSFTCWWTALALCVLSLMPSSHAGIDLPRGYGITEYTTEKVTGESCRRDSDCETPMEYLLMSRCPFVSLCLQNACTVVCPDFSEAPAR